MYSNVASKNYGASSIYKGSVFKFHAPAEHTVDNKRFDLELQVFFNAPVVLNNIKIGAIGILFDVEDYNIEGITNRK